MFKTCLPADAPPEETWAEAKAQELQDRALAAKEAAPASAPMTEDWEAAAVCVSSAA